jgi:hypothetical protein
MNIFTAKTQRAQRKDNFILSLRKRQNNKINNLCALCVSNERSEWAVSYSINRQIFSMFLWMRMVLL